MRAEKKGDQAGGRSGPGWRLPPQASRLGPPLASPYEVPRTQICEQIFSAGGARLVLIHAAAGFGKTTLMRQVLESCNSSGLANAWLNLDPADNDVSRFLSGLAAALEGIMPGISAEGEATLLDDGGGRFAVQLLERIGQHREAFVLFLDDFEMVQSPAELGLVQQMIRRLPAGAQLVIGSRSTPDLGLGRLRAMGWLLEIEPAQLRFTLEETGDFIRARRRLDLPAREVAQLHARTEGWPAALWLASLALTERERSLSPASHSRERAADFIAHFSGSDAGIADYLAEDVLAHQPEELRSFLLRTSILNPLSAPLCDAVCGRNDSRELLERLDRANLFLVPLDNQRKTYRYHGLFSEFLRGQLERTYPREVRVLHHAAAEWYRAEERPVPAIEHALASGNLEYALPMLAEHAAMLLADARMRLLARWLGGISPEDLKPYPMLRIIHAWALDFTRGPHEAMELIEGFVATDTLDDDSASHLLALKPLLLLQMDRIEEAYELALTNFGKLPARTGFGRSMLANALGTVSIIRGQFAEAQSFLSEARRVQAPLRGTFSVVLSESAEGAMDLLRGRLRQAVARLRGTVEPRVVEPTRYAKANALAGVLLAEALYEADECAEAERLLTVYVPLIKEGGMPDQLISGHVLIGRLLANRGDHDQAFQALMELEYLGHRLKLPRVVASAKLERARLALAQGMMEAAAEELESAYDSRLWSRVTQLFMVANDADTLDIAKLRWMVRSGRAAQAVTLLTAQLGDAESAQRMRRALKLRILLAEALYRSGQNKLALRHFGTALQFGGREGFVRSFADEGETVVKLIHEWSLNFGQVGHGVPPGYLDRLLLAAGQRPHATGSAAMAELAEPFTRKELAVLRLLAEGLSNRALAQKLFVSETTIRSHLRNINVKLGVHSRAQAIVAARRSGIIK